MTAFATPDLLPHTQWEDINEVVKTTRTVDGMDALRKIKVKGPADLVFIRDDTPEIVVASTTRDRADRVDIRIEDGVLRIRVPDPVMVQNNLDFDMRRHGFSADDFPFTIQGGIARVIKQAIKASREAPYRLGDAIFYGGIGQCIEVVPCPVLIGIALPELPRLILGGAGNFTGYDVNQDTCQIKLKGAGNVTLHGSAQTIIAELTGAGDIDTEGMIAQHARLRLAGAGDMTVSGAGDITICGNPAQRHETIRGVVEVIWRDSTMADRDRYRE